MQVRACYAFGAQPTTGMSAPRSDGLLEWAAEVS
jgi:hypothetical protein